MSKGFVGEYDDMRLNEVPPGINALLRFLKQDSNGVTINQERMYIHPNTGSEVYVMSNGLSYSLSEQKQWYVVD